MAPVEKTRRIARNTLMLYLRLMVLMVVTLYTSRIVLEALGVEDFGIYNLIAGVVILFSFLNAALTSATQRFLNYELGCGKEGNAGRVFGTSLTVHAGLAVILLILGETVGLWFANTQLAIPAERMGAANWVYQFAILTACVNIIRVPYNATIVAHEKMSFYALLSIAEAVLRLGTVFLLLWFGSDKLVFYAVLTFIVSVVIFFLYRIYCRRIFAACRCSMLWDKRLFMELLGFSGWSLVGSSANVGAQQGINIMLNVFWGLTTNAAIGIATQLTGAVYSFAANFQTAFNPQIVKSYAEKDWDYFRSLIFRASKFSYFLLLALSLPVLFEIEFILNLWLVEVPQYAASFCRFILIFMLLDAISAPLWMSVQATGRIRSYQTVIGTLTLLTLPFAYFLLKAGYPPESALVVRIFINLAALAVRIFYMRKMFGFSVGTYMRKVMLKIAAVTVLSLPLPLWVSKTATGNLGAVLTITVAVVSVAATIYFAGLDKPERAYAREIVRKHFLRIK